MLCHGTQYIVKRKSKNRVYKPKKAKHREMCLALWIHPAVEINDYRIFV